MEQRTPENMYIHGAYLKLAAPDVVYAELEAYGAALRKDRYVFGIRDEGLEESLAARDDRLISLGLAKNAGSYQVVAKLYRRALEGTGDAGYDIAVRVACLANEAAPGMLLLDDSSLFGDGEFRRM